MLIKFTLQFGFTRPKCWFVFILLNFAVHAEILNPIFGHVQATWARTCTFAPFPPSGFSSVLKKCFARARSRKSRFSNSASHDNHKSALDKNSPSTLQCETGIFTFIHFGEHFFEKLPVKDRNMMRKDAFSDLSAFTRRDWVTSSDWAEPATLYMSEWARPGYENKWAGEQ